MAGLSIFFKIGDETNDFWDWLDADSKEVHLDEVFTVTSSMINKIYGYIGSNTEPDCSQLWCWYINKPST